jgi:hypothetical protein
MDRGPAADSPVFDAHRVAGRRIGRSRSGREALMPPVPGPASAGPHAPSSCCPRLAGLVRRPGPDAWHLLLVTANIEQGGGR